MLFHIGFSMFVTFIVFPGVTDDVFIPWLTNLAWLDLFMVTTFNIFDTVGRFIGGVPSLMLKKESPLIHALGFGRLIFVAIAILIQVGLITQTSVIIINMVLFALTNGYIQTLACVYAANMVPEES